MDRPDYSVCERERCEDCLAGKFATCRECSYCMNRLLPARVYPFEEPNQIDEEAVHLPSVMIMANRLLRKVAPGFDTLDGCGFSWQAASLRISNC